MMEERNRSRQRSRTGIYHRIVSIPTPLPPAFFRPHCLQCLNYAQRKRASDHSSISYRQGGRVAILYLDQGRTDFDSSGY